MQLCDFQNLSKWFLYQFNEGANTKYNKVRKTVPSIGNAALIVKLNLRKSYLGLCMGF